jgi:hypothetical protein
MNRPGRESNLEILNTLSSQRANGLQYVFLPSTPPFLTASTGTYVLKLITCTTARRLADGNDSGLVLFIHVDTFVLLIIRFCFCFSSEKQQNPILVLVLILLERLSGEHY